MYNKLAHRNMIIST